MSIEERIAALEAEIRALKAQPASNTIDRWAEERANALQAELKWERPRIYNSIQTPFSAIIRSTILGENYRSRRLLKLNDEEKRIAIAMWDALEDVVRRYARRE